MRLSYRTEDGLTHHISRLQRYANVLRGAIACGVPWPQPIDEDRIRATHVTCILCALSPRSRPETTYINEDC